jgi:hypothetical protein
MRCVTKNKSSFFAPKLEALENKKKSNVLAEQQQIPIVLKTRDINSCQYSTIIFHFS